MKRYLKNFENCLEKEIPYCAAECPFHMEIFNFMEKTQRGAFQAAFRTYRNAVGFPRIANALCHAPCKNVCPRKDSGGGIEMSLLEKAALEFAGSTSATDYNIPQKKEKVAIVGAGISGMAACLRLSTKKYQVEVFEAGDKIGGRLWELMDSEVFLKDMEEQLAHQEYTLHFNTKITTLAELSGRGFDAIYVATGKGGDDFGLLAAENDFGEKYCMEIDGTGCFAGGALTGDEPIYALAGGLHIGTVIDNYLKTKNLYYPKNGIETRMCQGMAVPEETVSAVVPKGDRYTEEEAREEAQRCIRCQCDACRRGCDLTQFADKWPIRIRDEIVATTLQGKSELKATPAKRLMSMCNQCGLCKEICPEDIDMDGLFLAGRASMHQQKKAPWPFHDFWLRDMKQAEDCGITRPPKGQSVCKYAFFPGCQLPGSDPDLTEKAYEALTEIEGDTGLMLRCCGVPLEWAGRQEEFSQALDSIRQDWEAMGRPTLIVACPTCMKKFKEHLPEISLVSLYERLAEADNFRRAELPEKGKTYSVFDACSARHEEGTKAAVRELVQKAGCGLAPLAENEAYGRCCSFGGQGAIASPEYQQFVAQKRVAESENPYITYCINCRDAFLTQGKETVHILELLLRDGQGQETLPTVTERQHNRAFLKKRLLEQYWEEIIDVEKSKFDMTIHMSQDLRAKLSGERILEEEIAHTIDFCQRRDRRIYNEETETYSGYCQIGHMTFWIEYKVIGQAEFELCNAYSHRMKIELEAVWNGVKQDIDLQ